MQLHHIKQVAEGGTNDIDNIIVLCPNCHTKAHRGLIKESELKALAHTALYEKAIPSKPLKSNRKATEFELLIKGKLAENGLNLTKLAEMLGTSHSNVSQRLKRGSFSSLELYHIADLLGYDIHWVKKS